MKAGGVLVWVASCGLLLPACLDPFPEDPGTQGRPSFADNQPLPGNTVPAGVSPIPTATSGATVTTSPTSSAAGGGPSSGGGEVVIGPPGVAPVTPATPVGPPTDQPLDPHEPDAAAADIADDEPDASDAVGTSDAGDAGGDAATAPFSDEVTAVGKDR